MNRLPVLIAFTTLILVATLAASLAAENRTRDALVRPLEKIPMVLEAWSGSPGPPLNEREAELLAATSHLSRTYETLGQQLSLSIAYYEVQKAGESMHTPKNCLPGTGWEIVRFDDAQVTLGNKSERINKFSIQNGGQKALVLYWYQTKDRIIANEYAGKGFMIWDAITKGRTAGSVVRIILPESPEAAAAGLDFASLIMAEMKINFGS
jgi:EpsI family protein